MLETLAELVKRAILSSLPYNASIGRRLRKSILYMEKFDYLAEYAD